MSNNITFITNEDNNSLLSIFNENLTKNKYFDCIVGYFFLSGFNQINNEIKDVKKIRILIGMGTDDLTFNIINQHNQTSNISVKDKIIADLKKELYFTKTSKYFENCVKSFYNFLKEEKIIIKAYPKRNLHSKMYLLSSNNQEGSVIIGSSNLTSGGLENNLELNVKIDKNEEYNYCKDLFEKYWADGIDITEEYIKELSQSYTLNELSPEDLYYKFLYEYFGNRIDWDKDNEDLYIPDENFKKLNYQIDAVIQAKSIVEKYNGVFLADVVGLGKTYMGSMLLQQLKGKSLVIVPPQLMQNTNPGSWRYILNRFNVDVDIVSSGNLKNVVKEKNLNLYKNVLVDEAHTFRNESTAKYDFLQEICRNKKIILVSATPYNNNILDIVNLIKLFQPAHNSSLPNSKVKDIEGYFKNLNKELDNAKDNYPNDEYIKFRNDKIKDIKNYVLKHLMVRRTRKDILNYYNKDSKNIMIPECEKPEKISYKFTPDMNELFDETLEIITKEITYARYTPYSDKYYKGDKSKNDFSQNNIRSFIKVFLFKRLESDIQSFTKTLDSFIKRHEKILEIYDSEGIFLLNKGNITYEKLEKDSYDNNFEEINLIDLKYQLKRTNFTDKFRTDLEKDLNTFRNLYNKWNKIESYPKREILLKKVNSIFKHATKLVIFTEFIDTANYLKEALSDYKVLVYTGKSSKEEQTEVIYNFDQNIAKNEQRNEYNILISTDVLSHGVNLHRAHYLINYDIPWNPTKIMQRVGRVQRVQSDNRNRKIYIYNFFPPNKVEDNTKIGSIAQNKIEYFVELLGNDSKILFDEEITSNEFFNKINANPDELDEDSTFSYEIKYLEEIRTLRDKNPNYYEIIKNMAYKSRVSVKDSSEKTITLFKVNTTPRIIITDSENTEEIDYLTAVKYFENYNKESKTALSEKYYDNVNKNTKKLEELLYRDNPINLSRPQKTTIKIIEYILSNKEVLTTVQKEYLIKLRKMLKKGLISYKDCRDINKIKKYADIQKLYKEIEKIISFEEVNNTIITVHYKDVSYTEVLNKEFRR